jgi:putative acetyltransferase
VNEHRGAVSWSQPEKSTMESPTTRPSVSIVRFEDRFAADFERLNRLWLEGHGILEAADLPYLREPRRTILAPGGEIFVALQDGIVIGVCGIIPRTAAEFELVKLAVDPTARGLGLGRRLAELAIGFARERGAQRVALSTSSKLTVANALYRKLGFVARPTPETPDFATADVYLELALRGDALRIVPGGLDSPAVQALLAEHLADMHRISPPESVHALDLSALRDSDITFWTVWIGDDLAGCSAVKDLGDRRGEVKSMRTAPAHRGRGVARAMLEHILEEAQRRGYTRLLLETGSQPEFLPARRLYEKYGFVYCGPFEGYTDDPNSVFMERVIAPLRPLD